MILISIDIMIHCDSQITVEFTFKWFEIEVHTVKCEAQFVIEMDFVQMFSVFQRVVEYCVLFMLFLFQPWDFQSSLKGPTLKKKKKIIIHGLQLFFVLLIKALGFFVMLMWWRLSVSTTKHNKYEKNMQLISCIWSKNLFCSNGNAHKEKSQIRSL